MSSSQKLNKENVEDMFQLTHLQEEMLFTYLKDEKSEEYFEQLSLSVKGNVNIDIFKKAWQKVIESNEMLRTIYRWKNVSNPIQIVLKKHEIPTIEIDLSTLEEEAVFSNLNKIRLEDREKGIDISKEPMRITLCKVTKQDYEIIISSHHIIYDGWSNGIILKEFFNNYNDLYEGKIVNKKYKSKYKEFIKLNRNIDKSIQKEYWKNYFNEFDITTELPYKINSSKKEKVMEDYIVKLPNVLKEKVENYCKNNGFSIASFFYSVWGILLQKYNNTNDSLIGITVSGRKTAITEVNDIVGLFINTLPLRIKADYLDNIIDICKNTQKDLIEIDENDSLSLNEIKECANIDLRGGLFNSLVVIENYPLDMSFLNNCKNLKVKSYSMFENTNFDLTFEISIFHEIIFKYSYNTNSFEEGYMKKVSSTYIRFIELIIENKNLLLSNLDLVSDIEEKRILYDFKGPVVEYPRDKNIYELFKEAVLKTPDNIALILKKRNVTYKELDDRVISLTEKIAKCNIGKGNIVGIIVDRSLEIVISILAVIKSGAAYLPIDGEYPLDRINYMLKDSNASLILTKKNLQLKINYNKNVLYIDENDEDFKDSVEVIDIVPKDIVPKDTAYVIYTSGSTGKPKGVIIKHKSIINTLYWRKNYYKFNENDVILQLPSFSFDSSVEDIFTPLILGSKVVILTKEQRHSLSEIEKIIKEEKVTHFLSVPSFYRTMLQEIPDSLVNMKTITIAGENFGDDLVSDHFNKLQNVELYNEYGPTENSVCTTVYKFTKNNIKLLIGKPINNTQCLILDKNNKLMPIGVAGELCISGVGIAYGYLGKEGLTNEKFIKNPINSNEIIYKTGDLAKFIEDGNIRFLGRIDHQIKIRGFRIELGEIENVILKSSKVDNVIVIQDDESLKQSILCAFIVSKYEISINEIKEKISMDLLNYMIPNYFIQVKEFPLTPNGKIDRKELLNILSENINNDKSVEKPKNEVQMKIYDIWSDVLGVEKIDINDNFFDVGGDSLKLMRIHFKIDKLYPQKITIAELFGAPTVKRIADKILEEEENKKLEIEPEYFEISKEYLSQEKLNNNENILEFKIENNLFNDLCIVCKKYKKNISELLLSAYFYLLFEIGNNEKVIIQTIVNKEDVVEEIDVNFKEVESLTDLFEIVSNKLRSEELISYKLNNNNFVKINKENNMILPMFVLEDKHSKRDNIFKSSDILIILLRWNNSIKLTLRYRNKKINEDKIDTITNYYLKIIKNIAAM